MLNHDEQIYPPPNSAVSVHPVGDELIIFDDRSKQLARMNQTATKIWQLHEENLSVDEIAQHLSEFYSVEKEVIISDVINALNEWQAMGLIGEDNIPVAPDVEGVLDYMEEIDSGFEDKIEFQHVKSIKLLDSGFDVFASSAEITNILLPVISHYPKTDNFTNVIKVIEKEDCFLIIDGSKLVCICDTIEEVAPVVNGHILVTSFLNVNSLSVFHAAAIYDNDGIVLLSAGSGSGKSTLTAALMCTGKQLFSDDLGVLTHDQKIRPTPGCIGLKKGSWDVIERYYPAIFELATHYRQDKKIVKYLPPSSLPTSSQLENGEPVKAVVFPNYSPEHKSELIPLSTADALVKITDAGYHTNQSLNHGSVANLIGWMKEIPAYELPVNDLKEAVNLVETLF
ncbi:MAG: PqqD family peptide modification chaperone [Gammaproteobacteria bacterium]|nr:PqqD family peptide modification chaperone [Gammaproteobacteria bacterium]